jgi:predicted TIM-barrel fold metal-dependent hydrolase
MNITDCHVHIQPWVMVRPGARTLLENRRDGERILRMIESPAEFLRYLDECGVWRAVLINYVSDIMGFTEEVNEFVAGYCAADPKRLIACGGLHPTGDVRARMQRILRLGVKVLKIHPPHQMFSPNDYLDGNPQCLPALGEIYRTAEANGIPVVVHTGTSIFPGARNKYGDPMFLDDVAVDFPRLKLVMAHGGRPLWTEAAFFLLRRHPNLYFDLSGIPPKTLLRSFPRLQEIAHKCMFGTDWPGPGVPGIAENLTAFQQLEFSPAARDWLLWRTAEEVFGA